MEKVKFEDKKNRTKSKVYLGIFLSFFICSTLKAESTNTLDNPLSETNIQLLLKDYQAAIDNYSRQIKQNPKEIELYFRRGIAELMYKKFPMAIGDFTQAIQLGTAELNKTVASEVNHTIKKVVMNAYYYRALSKKLLNELGPACDDLKNASALGHPDAADKLKKYCSTPEIKPKTKGY